MNNTPNNNNNSSDRIDQVNNNTTEKIISTDHPFRFLTQNIQGFNSTSKQEQILDFMSSYNVDVLGLSETNLPNSLARHIYKKNSQYTAYFNNHESDIRGSGVGLVFNNYYAKNIHRVHGYKGRIIYADLFFKGRTKFRIIQIYLPASPRHDPDLTKDIHRQLITYIEDALRKQYKLIVMGDFNV